MKIDNLNKFFALLTDNASGLYKFSSSGNPTILATDFVLMTMYLARIDEKINKEAIYRTLSRHKSDSNNFIDLNFDDQISRGHKVDYIINQFTYFTLIALDQCGYHYNRLNFFDQYLQVDNLKKWINTLNWAAFWYESNKIMFWLYFYFYVIRYGDIKSKDQAVECLDYFFSILDEKQDLATGYWGTNLNNNNIIDGCFGAAHIYLFYDYYNLDIKYEKQIIDNTLSLHSKNGLILTEEGGACEDYDVIEIYLRILKRTDYKKQEILNRLDQIREVISKNQEKDGGFPYHIPKNLLGIYKLRKNKTYNYSSWEFMKSKSYYSDTWGTYFRILSLAAIERIINGENSTYKSYDLPGWGYL